jgi:putative membrane protein
MFINAFFAFLHFLAAFGVVATVTTEWLTLNRTPSHAEALRLQRIDTVYGIFAMLLLVVGFLRVFHFEKSSAYYFSNHFFWTKLALFAIVGLLSIYPTVQFLGWRKDTREGRSPVLTEPQFLKLRLILRLEVSLLVAIAFCASMMAKGLGS